MAGSSTASEVRVRFTVETRSGVLVDEPDAVGLTLPVGTYRRVRGQVRIRSGRLPVVQPEDELVPLVTNPSTVTIDPDAPTPCTAK